jgi:hypothetical protein
LRIGRGGQGKFEIFFHDYLPGENHPAGSIFPESRGDESLPVPFIDSSDIEIPLKK